MELTRADQELTAEDGMDVLLNTRETPCVSVYLTTGCTPDTSHEAIARLKSLLRSAETQLKAAGEDPKRLQGLRQLLNDNDTWPYQGQAAALFASDEVQRFYSLPYSCEDRAVLDNRFYMVPLVQLTDGNGVFYVLVLSQENTRLLRATRHGMVEVDLGDVPTSLAADLRHDVFETSIQVHTGRTPTTGGQQQSTMFHGHGAAGDKANMKRKLHHMFEHIDNAVCDIVGPENAPLVLAGLDYMQGLYRELNHYSHLLDDGVRHNPEDMNADDLHQAAWKCVSPVFERDLSERKDRYQSLAGNDSDRADERVESVTLSAINKRIDTLFVQQDAQQWGTIDVDNQTVTLTERDDANATELINVATVETIANGGKVYALASEHMPAKEPVAAIYRF